MKKRKVHKNGKARNGDLQFLLQPPKQRTGWTDKKIKCFVRYSRTTGNKQRISKAVGLSVGAVTNMRRELRQAATKGYDLCGYLKAGRPFRTGAKVLAK